MKRAMQNAMRPSSRHQDREFGRLNGAEIARTEWYREGRAAAHPACRHRLVFRSVYHLRCHWHQGGKRYEGSVRVTAPATTG